ncbi:MAG: S8 family serine peptidase [Solirubrobacterales bacterium]|nr:S8 family serine peptidase [Solirubrobacterales bacterium]
MRRGAVLLSLLAVLLLQGATDAPAATPTGNLLVLFDDGQSAPAASQDRISALGGRPAGRSVPEIGLVTIRPPSGVSAGAFAQRLAALPGVASVQPELRYQPRAVPDDPALRDSGPARGVPWQWYLAREGFFRAWTLEQGRSALVAVIDSGIDGRHPDLAPKIAAAIDQQAAVDSTGPANTDQVGHGTNVASLACADTDNGIGMAGAGYGCRLVIEKTDFTDSSIAAAIVDATKRHVDAINMSFGPAAGGANRAPHSEIRALRYAVAHRVVLVAAASDSPGIDQGDPANILQPAGSGASITRGIGLDVTSADYAGRRSSFAGSGSEISLAAYGEFRRAGNILDPCRGPTVGVFGAFPGNSTEMESFPPTACRVKFHGDDRYATIAGTSMAAPQVAAVGALMRVLNPYATLADILQAIKRTATRPRGARWTGNLGWGILDAGAALEAIRRVDRLPPRARLFAPRVSRRRSFVLRWIGRDQRRPGLIASGIAYYELFVRSGGGRSVRLLRTTGHSFRFTGRPGHRYTFWVVAVDRAGNRERGAPRVTTLVA